MLSPVGYSCTYGKSTLAPIRRRSDAASSTAYPSPKSDAGGSLTVGAYDTVDVGYFDVPMEGWQVMDQLMDLKMEGNLNLQYYLQHFHQLTSHPSLPTIPSGFKLHLFLRGLSRVRQVSAKYHLHRHPAARWTDVANSLVTLEKAETDMKQQFGETIQGPARPVQSPISYVRTPQFPPVQLLSPDASQSSRPTTSGLFEKEGVDLPAGFAPVRPNLHTLMGRGLDAKERDAVAGIVGLGIA